MMEQEQIPAVRLWCDRITRSRAAAVGIERGDHIRVVELDRVNDDVAGDHTSSK